PRFRGDRLPKTAVGIAVSLADKLDTVVGSILIGEEPTGSRDPYGLRRKANGIVRIALERELDLDFYRLIRDVEELYDFLKRHPSIEKAIDFLNERLYQILLQEYGLDYDILDATTSVGEGNLWRVLLKSQALQRIRSGEGFEELAVAFSRVRNITSGYSIDHFNPELFEEEAERELWRAYLEARKIIEGLEPERRYDEILQELLELKGPIDRYFDDVLVMCNSRELRENRLGFLLKIVELFSVIGDLSKVVISGS
ncbi:TPA: glycine--tRNA ligase subunit beta, partial [Candidatus Bipolaricaulota bacterium]|nr:glycine--tRNA ligase subunit beta [Candidatus Bipolaricaulota bacterium]